MARLVSREWSMRLESLSRVGGLAASCLLAVVARAPAQDGPWVLTNVRIETVTRGVIERGTVVIRDGLIAAVGADVAAPADARVLDLAGKTVVPAFIDLTSSLGLASAPPPAAGGRPGGGAAAAAGAAGTEPTYVGLEPYRVVADELRPAAADLKATRDAGFGAVLSAPGRGAFRGLSALVPLRDSAPAGAVIRSPVALHMGFQSVAGRYPGTLLGVIAYERQALYDARRQGSLLDRYRAGPRGMERPPYDRRLNALVPVVRGDLPVFFAAGNENEIRRAVAMAREFNLTLTVVGASEGFRAVDALLANRRPVVVSVDFPRPPEVTGWSFRAGIRHPPDDSASADSAARRVIEGNAATLDRAGVRLALASGGTLRASEFLANVRKVIAAGLPRDVALEALTIRPAEVAGVADQLGSIEAGKIANLVVTDGDLLGDSAKVSAVFVDGVRYEVVAPAPSRAAARAAEGAAGEAAAQVAGTWSVTVSMPEGSQSMTMALSQSGEGFTGTMTGEMGSLPVADGQIGGRTVTWSVTVPMGGQTMVERFQGEVEGNRIRGTVELGAMGTAPFTAEKTP
jgi:imidazolonepropionase-like amidohydrolase